MGYEIAGALGAKLADPGRDVICMVGDGSYLMANSELATAVTMGIAFTVVLTDNRGFGCINRLQQATGGAEFNNLLSPSAPQIDFAAHAASLGARARHVGSIAELEQALAERKTVQSPYVIVIDTDPAPSEDPGGFWWDVAVPEVSTRDQVVQARADYDQALGRRG